MKERFRGRHSHCAKVLMYPIFKNRKTVCAESLAHLNVALDEVNFPERHMFHIPRPQIRDA